MIETKSFIPKNICDNEKYIHTTQYVTITTPQKVLEKYLNLSTDTGRGTFLVSPSWIGLTPTNPGVLKNSVCYESWLQGSAELVEENTDVPCFMKQSKMPFWEMLG